MIYWDQPPNENWKSDLHRPQQTLKAAAPQDFWFARKFARADCLKL
jgi:hypothetical protein